jgi:hypothetical protein
MAKATENNTILYPKGLKRCKNCSTVKSFSEFPIKNSARKCAGLGSMLNANCKTCTNKRCAGIRARQRENPKWYCKSLAIQLKHRAKTQCVLYEPEVDGPYLFSLLEMQDYYCYYTGKFMDFMAHTEKRTHPHINYPSIDRLIPKKGYVRKNLVWCRYGINRMKNELTCSEFINFCRLVLDVHD